MNKDCQDLLNKITEKLENEGDNLSPAWLEGIFSHPLFSHITRYYTPVDFIVAEHDNVTDIYGVQMIWLKSKNNSLVCPVNNIGAILSDILDSMDPDIRGTYQLSGTYIIIYQPFVV